MGSSPLLKARQQATIKVPKILSQLKSIRFDQRGKTESIGDQKAIEQAFSYHYGKPLLHAVSGSSSSINHLKIGVVLSGGQAAGGHNVIIGLYDGLKQVCKEFKLFGFLNGPKGIFKGLFKELKEEELLFYRNTGGFDLIGSGRDKIETQEQLKASLEVVKNLDLDGLVVIGGDDSNTNAAVLAQFFSANECKTKVIGVPKTIDGDLKNAFVEISFGFDTACKTYSEMIGNLARDALSAKKYYHFVKLMGRSASHIALECALQTHPNLTIIAEEVFEKKLSLKDVVSEIANLVIERHKMKKSYGLILIPEGLIELIDEIKTCINEINQILAKENPSEPSGEFLRKIEQKLTKASLETFQYLPSTIQKQLMLDRDPHGNVQVALIETEKLLIEKVSQQLKEKNFEGSFNPISHFFGYEGRAGFPSNFDAYYCYSLGLCSIGLIKEGFTGYMACVKDLIAPVENWQAMGIPLTSLMRMELRKGKMKPVIEKALVKLEEPLFKIFEARRKDWRLEDDYCFPGPIQFYGDLALCEILPMSLQLK